MALEITTNAPSLDAFTSLSDHQTQTPGTFFGARPVLHHHSPGAKIVVSRTQYDATTALHEIKNTEVVPSTAQNGHSVEGEDVVILGVDVWVTSKYAE